MVKSCLCKILNGFEILFDVSPIYKNSQKTREPRSICLLYQPEKARRDPDLTLKIAKDLSLSGLTVYLYGNEKQILGPWKSLGILSVNECSNLYNNCIAGFIVQYTNKLSYIYKAYVYAFRERY